MRSTSSSPARKRWLPWLAAVVLGLVVGFIVFAIRVSALWSCRASGPSWSFPSRVYCDDVPLVAGRVLPAPYLLAQLEARGYRSVTEPGLAAGTFSRRGEVFEIGLRGFAEARDPRGTSGPERVRVRIHDGWLVSVDRLGAPLGARESAPVRRRADSRLAPAAAPRLEPVLVGLLYDRAPTWRVWVALDRVPQAVRDAIVASEDRRFWSHPGVDARGYLRALAANVRAGGVRQGGSTITQQLSRSLFLGRQRTLGRKLAEVPLALGLEAVLGKRRILEMYLNAVYWGQAGGLGVGGLGAAAQWYFDAPVESLGVLEGATLAAMIPAPNLFDPFERPNVVLERRNQVLRNLVAMRRLDADRAQALSLEPLNVRRGAAPMEIDPSYVGFVRDQLNATLPGEVTARHGLAVFTCMDLVWQRAAETGLAQAVAALDGGGRTGPPLEGAFVALEPGTGAVRALVGGRAPQPGGFNRTYQAHRQTGSAIKPIVYAAAFASGQGFTPATVVPDVPRTFPTDRGPWTPRNDDGTYHTQVTLVKALERSLNVATTNLVDRVGPREVARVARRLGLGELKPVMSIGLGSNESTLLDLTRAFAVFGDGGRLFPCTAVRAVTDRSGRIVERQGRTRHRDANGVGAGTPTASGAARAIPEPVAALMTGLLTNVVRFGVAYPLRKTYGFLRPLAGKTGTTDDYRDAWFIGFTPDVVAGVWVGYDRPRSLGRLAVDTALPAWARIVGPLLQGFPPRSFANDVQLEWREVEPWTGFLAGPECRGEPVPFLRGTAPRAFCPPGTLLGPELESPDSLPGSDSAGVGETPTTQNER